MIKNIERVIDPQLRNTLILAQRQYVEDCGDNQCTSCGSSNQGVVINVNGYNSLGCKVVPRLDHIGDYTISLRGARPVGMARRICNACGREEWIKF